MAQLIVDATTFALLGVDGTNYTTVHNTANAEWVDASQISASQNKAFSVYGVERSGVVFDTSTIPADATITSATLSVQYAASSGDMSFNVTIVSGVDLGDTIVAADYGDLVNDTTSFGEALASDLDSAGYHNIDLNATGIAAIVKAGTTRFGIRSSRDISSTAPTGGEAIYFGAARLIVNYTTPPTGYVQAFIIG